MIIIRNLTKGFHPHSNHNSLPQRSKSIWMNAKMWKCTKTFIFRVEIWWLFFIYEHRTRQSKRHGGRGRGEPETLSTPSAQLLTLQFVSLDSRRCTLYTPFFPSHLPHRGSSFSELGWIGYNCGVACAITTWVWAGQVSRCFFWILLVWLSEKILCVWRQLC